MSDTSRPHEDEAVQLTTSEQPEAALSDYEELAESWARQGWLLRAVALCRVILRLEPGHEPTRRLLAELDARRMDVSGTLSRVPAIEEGPSRASLFSRLGEREFLSVLEALELRDFQPGETIIEEGQPGSSLFAIVEGSVEVVRSPRSGRQRTVAFLGEGDFFGEMSLLSAVPRLASVRAFERTAVLELTRERLERIIQRHPSVGEVLRSFHRERLLDEVLRSNPIFRLLTPSAREALAHDFQLCSRPAGTLLLEQGQAVDGLYVLLRGRCQVRHRHPDGSESHLRTLGEGDVFGEIALMLGLQATATVRADTSCLLLRLDWGSCERTLLEEPEVCEALSKIGNERLLSSAGLLFAPGPDGGAPRV
jgi:cAMP-dependent protein kinase regulator